MGDLLDLDISRPEKNVLFFRCRGEFAGLEILEREAKVFEAMAQSSPGTKVIFDFAAVSYIDSAGVGVLYKALKKAQGCKVKLLLMHPNADIKKILVTAAIPKVIEILD